ncbi:hypothetical protein ABI59_05320 [Acidobacteria bacterium Mor1]|nr:hypothetical protein ABI59_05320 [Acidobacteria bacterium Mor1]
MRYRLGSYIRHRDGVQYRAFIEILGRRRSQVVPNAETAKRLLRTWSEEKVLIENRGHAVRRAAQPDVTYAEMGKHLEAFWASGVDRVRTGTTLRGYRLELQKVLKVWGTRRVAETRPIDIQRYADRLRMSGLSTSTVRHFLDKLSAMHRLAVDLELLLEEPCPVPRPRLIQRSERPAISEPALERLVAAAREHPDWRVLAAILLAADAGLRRGELIRLRRRDLRLDGDRPFIHVAVRSEADRTKAGRARDVPVLTPELLEALKAAPLGPAEQALFGSRDQDYRFDFLQSFWKSVLDQPAQLHQLRHRWVTRLLSGGTPTAVVQRWAGMRTRQRRIGMRT